jgi:hypothetical protein
MATRPTDSQTWDEVIQRLSGPSLDKAKVSELVGLLGEALGSDTTRLRVFPKGIPWPDGIIVHTVVNPRTLNGILKLLLTSPRIDTIRVFPRGIINPEIFLAEIEMS